MENVMEWAGFVLGGVGLLGALLLYISKRTKTDVDDKIAQVMIDMAKALDSKEDKKDGEAQ